MKEIAKLNFHLLTVLGLSRESAEIVIERIGELERDLAAVRNERDELKLQIDEIRANCDHEFRHCDDSFDHAHGCEVIRYLECEKCGLRKPDEDGPDDEPDYDAPKPLSALENYQRNDEHSPLL